MRRLPGDPGSLFCRWVTIHAVIIVCVRALVIFTSLVEKGIGTTSKLHILNYLLIITYLILI